MEELLGTVSTGVTRQAGLGPGTPGRGATRQGAVQGAKENKAAEVWLGWAGLGPAWHGVGGVMS